jgi:hypothetical protein
MDNEEEIKTEEPKQILVELPVHEMKRLLDQMTQYRDYLKEIVDKVNISFVVF